MAALRFTLAILSIFTVSCQGSLTPDVKILVADMKPAIHEYNLREDVVTSFDIEELERPIAIDVDLDRDELYWTDVYLGQIWARNLLTSETRRLLSQNSSSVMDGIAVDSALRRVFYTDTGYDIIATIDIYGGDHQVIVDSGLDEPRAIVLYEEKRKMYWTDWGRYPYIATATYEGTDIRKIVTTRLFWPNGLALDKKNGILYWCDGNTERIEAVNVDGSGRRVVISEPGTHYFDIFYINEVLYFTDWERRSLMSVAARGGEVAFINANRFNRLNGIYVRSNLDASETIPSWPRTTMVPPKHAAQREDPKHGGEGCNHGPPSHNKKTADNHSRNHVPLKHVILIGVIAGIVVILLIVAVIILAAVILLRRKQEVVEPSKNGGDAKQPPSLYTVAADLPPDYASVTKEP